jgi:hypothetical protein
MGLFKKSKKSGNNFTLGFDREVNVTQIMVDGVKYFRSSPLLSVRVVGVKDVRGPHVLKIKDTLSICNVGGTHPVFSIRNDGEGNFVLVLHPTKFQDTIPPLNATTEHLQEFDFWTGWGKQYISNDVPKEKKLSE